MIEGLTPLEESTIRLRAVLGKDADTLSESEREVALKMLQWATGRTREHPNLSPRPLDVVIVADAVKRAVEGYSGLPWDVIASSNRQRELVEFRFIAFYLLRELTLVPKCRIAEYLDIKRNHCTVLYGLEICEDLLSADRDFRSKYNQIYAGAKAIIMRESKQNTDAELNS